MSLFSGCTSRREISLRAELVSLEGKNHWQPADYRAKDAIQAAIWAERERPKTRADELELQAFYREDIALLKATMLRELQRLRELPPEECRRSVHNPYSALRYMLRDFGRACRDHGAATKRLRDWKGGGAG